MPHEDYGNKCSPHYHVIHRLSKITSYKKNTRYWYYNSIFCLNKETVDSLSFRQPIKMWKCKSISSLIKFSLFKYLGKRDCVLTRESSVLSSFGYTHHLLRSLVIVACHACMNQLMYMFRMYVRPHCYADN